MQILSEVSREFDPYQVTGFILLVIFLWGLVRLAFPRRDGDDD